MQSAYIASMKISISTKPHGQPCTHNDFVEASVLSMKHLGFYVCSYVWSPILWREGRRNSDNFISAELLVLDFDDGTWSIGNAINFMKEMNLRGMIGTTKSHQIPKSGQPACDRFRLIMQWSSPITDYGAYRQNVERILNITPADKACKDGARAFQPCKGLAYMQDGKRYEWSPFKAPARKEFTNDYNRKYGIMPRFIEDMIRETPGPGSRNKHCFRIACKMSEFGFSQEDCVNAVLSSAVDLPEREKLQAAKSGYRMGKKGYRPHSD